MARKIVPISIRRKRYEFKEYFLKKKIFSFMKRNGIDSDEAYSFLKENHLCTYPYNFIKKYKEDNIVVNIDSNYGMKYVLHENKRLYFKNEWSDEEIHFKYNWLLLEQDIDSPHRYEYGDFKVNEGDVVVDAGVAEGNFALSVVERVKKLYLFEADKDWIPILEKTFAPWKEKIVIINKYISDEDNDNEICFDEYFKGIDINFVKMDIEGSEKKALNGMQRILSLQENIKIAVCTYHLHNDAAEIDKVLQANNFYTEFSKGYMIFNLYDDLRYPYLRKGLIRAKKA